MDKPTEKDKTMNESQKDKEMAIFRVEIPSEEQLLLVIRVFLKLCWGNDPKADLRVDDLLADMDDEFMMSLARFRDQAVSQRAVGQGEEDQLAVTRLYVLLALKMTATHKHDEGMSEQEIIDYFSERGLPLEAATALVKNKPAKNKLLLLAAILGIIGLIAAVIFMILRKF
jgi:hypothetical protein